MGKDFENKMGITAAKSGRVRMMSEIINSTIFPGIQGGPLMHVIAAKAVALKEALEPEFVTYQKQVIANSKALGEALVERGFKLFSGGSDNHLLLVDLNNKNITGKDAEEALDVKGITVNKNAIPFDTHSPFITGGIRIGTPALSSRGMKENEMKIIAGWINQIINDPQNIKVREEVRVQVKELCEQFPIYK